MLRLLIVILVLAAAAGGVWFYVSQQAAKSQKERSRIPASAREAIAAANKLIDEAKGDIRPSAYSGRLAEVEGALNAFLNSSQSKDFPEFTNDLREALTHLADVKKPITALAAPKPDPTNHARKEVYLQSAHKALQRASTRPGM